MSATPVLPRPRRSLRRPAALFAGRTSRRTPVWAPARPSRGEVVFARTAHHVEPGVVTTVEGEVLLDPSSEVPSTGFAWIPVFSGFAVVGSADGPVEVQVRDGRFRVEVRALDDAAGSSSCLVVSVGAATGRADLTA